MSCTGTEPHSHAPKFLQCNRAAYEKGKGASRYFSLLENQKPMELLQIKLITRNRHEPSRPPARWEQVRKQMSPCLLLLFSFGTNTLGI